MVAEFFVRRFKNKMIWIAFEAFWNLLPVSFISLQSFGTGGLISNFIAVCIFSAGPEFTPPSIIKVVIDNNIHTIVKCIVYNFFYTTKHFFVNCIGCIVFFNHAGPCNRDTNGVKTIRMYSINIFLCGNGCTPCCFIISSITEIVFFVGSFCCFHCISEIYTDTHLFFDKLLRWKICTHFAVIFYCHFVGNTTCNWNFSCFTYIRSVVSFVIDRRCCRCCSRFFDNLNLTS